MEEWIYIGTRIYEFSGISCEIYESKDGKHGKRIWRYEKEEIYETYEIA